MPIGPPKCRTCQKIEWRHVCSGIDLKKVAAGKLPSKAPPKAKQRFGQGKRAR